MNIKYDIILTSWNHLDTFKSEIADLINSGALKFCERFIIVDRASTQKGVAEFLEDIKKAYGVYIVSLPWNRGVGNATNEGLGLSRAPYLFFPTSAGVGEKLVGVPISYKVNGWFLAKKDMQQLGHLPEYDVITNTKFPMAEFRDYIEKIKQL